ncbi:MAG: hypothetical protein MAG551_02088 [Candidatus Scalindua arabica]|uniref:Polymerase beta nucleotidyltransferase domain-containing protein n=1 Tax=Candidatus Scalindua arabica TaxID=1127984 RepID=A0A942A680_9BACT|nr:hypothetical protein [Candidatus Scalindua arabica]
MKRPEILKEIEKIKEQIIEKYRPEKIILFGSAAWGDKEINDIDFFIVKKDVPYYGGERMSELYKLIRANVAVDYIVYKPGEVEERLALKDPFVKKIFQKGTILYG